MSSEPTDKIVPIGLQSARVPGSSWYIADERVASRDNLREGLGVLTSCLVVLAGNDASDQGDGDDAEAHELKQGFVRESVASGDGL